MAQNVRLYIKWLTVGLLSSDTFYDELFLFSRNKRDHLAAFLIMYYVLCRKVSR